MKRSLYILAVGLMTAFAVASSAESNVAPPLGSIYLSAAADRYEPQLATAQVGDVLEFYLVIDIDFSGLPNAAANADNGVLAWEAGVTLPAELLLLDVELRPTGGVDVASGPTDFSVGVGVAGLRAVATPFAVVAFRVLIQASVDQVRRLDVVAATNPSLDPPVPLWVESQAVNGCTSPVNGVSTFCLRPFAAVLPLDLPVTVAIQKASWGTLKARFGA